MGAKINEHRPEKLSMGTMFGFGSASIGNSITYDFVITFLLFFLTDLAGINPAFAGTILLLSVLWDAITDPLVGVWSDRSKSKYGKRRPFILASAVPLGISVMLLFHVVDFDGGAKNVYYMGAAILFFSAFTIFSIPYYTLGGCITLDNDEKTKLSSIRQTLNYVGTFGATVLSLQIVGGLIDRGFSVESSWFYAAVVLGTIATITVLITWRTTRGKEIILQQEASQDSILKDIFEILKFKPYLLFILAALFYIVSYTFSSNSVMYFSMHVLGISEQQASSFFLIVVVVGGLLTASLSKIAVVFDKKVVFSAFLLFSGIAMVVASFLAISTYKGALIYIFFVPVAGAAFWTLAFVMLYDLADLDEFKSGKRRDGSIVSFFSFLTKVGAAIATQITGIVLEINGYNPMVLEQNEQATKAIYSLFTLYPGVALLIGGILIMFFPITRKRYQAMQAALELKRAGQPYSTEGFEELLK